MLHAAKRHHVADCPVGVDPHGAGFQCRRHSNGAANVLRPHARRQSVDRVVGHFDGLRLVIEAHDGQHRAEDFFPGDAHVRPHVHKNGGFDKLPTRQVGRCGRTAAQNATRAFGLGDVDVIQNFPVLRSGGDRANVGLRQHRVAFARGRSQRLDTLGEFFADGVLHQQARTGDASLPGGRENARDDAGRSLVNIAIVKHDVG